MGMVYEGGVPGKHNKYYGRSGLLEPVIVAPFYILGFVADSILGTEGSFGRLFFALAIGPILAGMCGLLVYLLCTHFYRPRTALFVACIYSFGTMAFPYSNLRSETTLTACFLVMLLGLVKYREEALDSGGGRGAIRALMAGMGAGAALAVKSYAVLLTLPGWVLFILIMRRSGKKKDLAAFFTPVIIFGLLAGCYNTLRFGNPLNTGYAATFGFDPAHLAGCLYVLFAGPAKSVFIFCPVLIAGVLAFRSFAEKSSLWAKFIIAETLLLVLFISTFREPLLFADEIWGSRYLFPVVLLWTLPAGVWLERGGRHAIVVWLLGIAGLVVSLPGVIIRPESVFVYSEFVCATPKYCRLLDPSMNAFLFNSRLLFGCAPSFMKAWSQPWIWWIQVLKPAAINPARAQTLNMVVTTAVNISAIAAAGLCSIGVVASLASLVRTYRSKD